MGRNSIKLAKVTKNTRDQERIPVFQITYLDKVADSAILLPYGLASRPIPGDTLCLVFSIQDNEENRIAIPLGTDKRKKGLKDGEVVLENQDTGAFFYFDENGDLQINVPRHIVEVVKNVTINSSGTISVTATGAAALTANGLTITSATTVLSGSLQVGTTFGCNGQAPQSPYPVNAAAVNNAQAIALVNQLRAALINIGIAV